MVSITSAAMFLVAPGSITPTFVLFAVVQFVAQMASPILWGMMADTVDYREFKTERRITGLVFSGGLFSLETGMAVGEAATQAPEAIRGIVLLFTLIPAIGHLRLILSVSRDQLDRERGDGIRAGVDRRQAGMPT